MQLSIDEVRNRIQQEWKEYVEIHYHEQHVERGEHSVTIGTFIYQVKSNPGITGKTMVQIRTALFVGGVNFLSQKYDTIVNSWWEDE